METVIIMNDDYNGIASSPVKRMIHFNKQNGHVRSIREGMGGNKQGRKYYFIYFPCLTPLLCFVKYFTL